MAVNRNRDNLLAVRLLSLKRHLMTCRPCKGAISASDPFGMCDSALRDIVFIATKWDANVPKRLATRRRGDDLLFLCPDLNAHGAAYAATAEPVTVVTTQDALF